VTTRESAEFSKELQDNDLEQVGGGGIDPVRPGSDAFKIIPNPSHGYIRIVNAPPGSIIRVSSAIGALLKQVTATQATKQ
jgi:hypothetical protein